MDLTHYRTLGRSGLVVSPLALGTMTFGAGRWGADEATSRRIFDAYVDVGGNFLDTADVYSGGESEAMLGRFLRDSGRRDRMVVATKSGFSRVEGNPLAAGNSARNIRDGLDDYDYAAEFMSLDLDAVGCLTDTDRPDRLTRPTRPRHGRRTCATLKPSRGNTLHWGRPGGKWRWLRPSWRSEDTR